MEISVIIPVFNDKRIKSCLNSLIKQNFPKNSYEIIVVDNNSDHIIKEIVKNYQVKYLKEIKQGSYSARNKGLTIAKGKIIVFIDSDCIADKDWLVNLIRKFKNKKIGGIGGVIKNTKTKTWVQKSGGNLVNQQLKPGYFDFFPKPFIVTANAAYRKTILDKVGGFDEQFKSGGDVDLSWRVNLLGFGIFTENRAIVYHEPRSSLKSYFKQYFIYGVGHTLLFNKYKQQAGESWYLNKYPIRYFMSSLKNLNSFQDLFLNFSQLIALHAGYIYGSIVNNVIFI